MAIQSHIRAMLAAIAAITALMSFASRPNVVVVVVEATTVVVKGALVDNRQITNPRSYLVLILEGEVSSVTGAINAICIYRGERESRSTRMWKPRSL